jgi:NADP-dependent 3-hydroxy acid dehydrogenase YdfG
MIWTQRRPHVLAGTTAVITGAGSGIGRALAQRLSAHGCPVAIADINDIALAETADSLRGPVLTTVLDVRDSAAQRDFAATVHRWTPMPIGAVFNNAGVAIGTTLLNSVIDDDQWLWDINFHGVVNGTRAFLPMLVEQGHGAIVNTSSVYGLIGVPAQTAYCAAKFAVRGFTEALRQEVRGTGVRAVTVHPGGVNTNIVRNARYHDDPEGLGRTHDDAIREFAAVTLTQPDRAAEIIHRGVDNDKARILIGPDAYLIDTLARIAPTHYDVAISTVRSLLRRRQSTRAPAHDRVTGAARPR